MACIPKYTPKPIRESPDMAEIAPRSLDVRTLLKLLEINAIVISHINKPTKMARLYNIT